MNYSNWINEDFSVSEANRWIRMGFDVDDALLWVLEEISPEMARNCVDLGLDFEQSMRWIKYGFSLEDAQTYALYGCRHPGDAECFAQYIQ